MFDYFRVAAFAALAFGAAGATGQNLVLPSGDTVTLETATTPLPAPPPVEPLPDILDTPGTPPVAIARPAIVDAEAQDAEVRAASLEQLVARHATADALDDEQNCLAGAVYFESKSEPLAGQLAVAKVILNRVASGRFASTVCGVVSQRGQFSFMHGGAMPAVARGGRQWRTAVAIARIASDGMWEAPAATALYFHARRVSPNWRMTRLASVGNHIFYR